MSTEPTNQQPGIGHNLPADAPDYAKLEVERLSADYGALSETVDGLLAEALALQATIEDDDTKGKVTSLIKRLRDATKRIEAFHDSEKQPWFRRGQGVDQFFFGLWDRCARRPGPKTNKPGAADVLQARLTDYDNRVLAREQERRRQEAELARREAAKIAAAAAAAAAQAEADRLAAERARNAERIVEKTAVAEQSESAAAAAQAEADVTKDRATEAHIATLARPAEIMRRRGDDGTLSTVQREPYAVVTDAAVMDKATLWPFISLDAKEKALRAWAKTTGHTTQMSGAEIGHRNRSVVR